MHFNHVEKLYEKHIYRLVDATGRQQAIGVVPCASCHKSLVMGVSRCPVGMHLTNTEALYLLEALRAGPAFPLLKPSPVGMGRKYFTQVVNAGKWLVGYSPDGTCDFLCCGGPPYIMNGGAAVALTTEQREVLADRIFTELMGSATNVATA